MCAHDSDVRKNLDPSVKQTIHRWNRLDDRDPEIRRANVRTQLKVLAIHAVFAVALLAYLGSGGHVAVSVLSILALGLVAIPLLRVFMHSQSHWKTGNGPIRNAILDHGISVLFGVAQTGYKYGHLAHHRYDNDYDPTGFPKDLQSTYIFSRNRKPTNIWLWCAFYLVVYQHAVHLFHVLNAPKRWEVAWYLFECLLIAAFHAVLYAFVPGFYLTVYLPALALGWLVSAVSLYMMHAVDLDEYELHPTVNSYNRLFNWFGDNDGYHLEHSLFPRVHPVFLNRLGDAIRPPRGQALSEQYFTAALGRLFGFRRSESQRPSDAGHVAAANSAIVPFNLEPQPAS